MYRLLLIFTLFLTAAPIFSREIWVVQTDAVGYRIEVGLTLRWWSDVIFHNQGENAAEVLLLGISNETAVLPQPDRILVPPRTTTSLESDLGNGWKPGSTIPLWVLRLDVPDTVVVEGTLQIGFEVARGIQPPNFTFEYGRLSLPVWSSLTPPNMRKVHLGADLGAIKSHLNVGVFNASTTQEASALIEIRRACDDALVATHSVTIPFNTIQQFGNLLDIPLTACGTVPGLFLNRTAYVAVIVDQPSLSYVAVVSNEGLPTVNSSIISKP